MAIKIYIVDTDEAHIQRVRDCIGHRRDMEIIGCANNGSTALKEVSEKKIDVLITELQLPGLDGILLLKDLQRVNRCPVTIVCTHFYSELCVDHARRYGASYVLYKPLDYHRLPEIISACHSARRLPVARSEAMQDHVQMERAQLARRLLMNMGMPMKLSGSLFLIEAMVCVNDSRTLLSNLTKGLYARVADRIQSTPAQVERSLRTAIAAGYDRGCVKQHFSRKPSNREFIEYMMQRMDEESL